MHFFEPVLEGEELLAFFLSFVLEVVQALAPPSQVFAKHFFVGDGVLAILLLHLLTGHRFVTGYCGAFAFDLLCLLLNFLRQTVIHLFQLHDSFKIILLLI